MKTTTFFEVVNNGLSQFNIQALTYNNDDTYENNVSALKSAVKAYLFDEVNNDLIIDLKSQKELFFVDFNSSQLANRCGLPQSSLSDKILKGQNGFIYSDKDVNIFELTRYLLDKKIETISVKDFRECIQETIYEIAITKSTLIDNKKIANVKLMKQNKITKIDDYIFILEDFSIVNGCEISQKLAGLIPAGKKYKFVVKF